MALWVVTCLVEMVGMGWGMGGGEKKDSWSTVSGPARPWLGAARCGPVRCGAVWRGTVWRGAVRSGAVRYLGLCKERDLLRPPHEDVVDDLLT